MNTPQLSQKLTVFYDGECIVCSREIEHYQKITSAESFQYIDISLAAFEPTQFGLTRDSVNRVMHVQDETGKTFTAVEAFIEIWKRIPKYRFLIAIVNFPLIRPFVLIGYHSFARFRKYLPKRKRADCETDVCKR